MKVTILFCLIVSLCPNQTFITVLAGTSSSSGGRVRGVSSAGVQRRTRGKKGPDKRDCKIEHKSDKVKVKCKSQTDNEDTEIKDGIEYNVKTGKKDEGLSVKVAYKQEIEFNETETETKTQFDVSFHSLIEYSSSSGGDAEAFDWENDKVIQNISLVNYEDFSQIMTDYDGVISTFSARSTDVDAVFNFTISRGAEGGENISTSVNRAGTGERSKITANQMKIDFSLADFKWKRNDTSVALLATIKSKKKIKVKYEDRKKKKAEDVAISFDEAIEGTGITPFGEFKWETTAIMNGTDTTMNANETNVTASASTIDVIATSPQTQDDDKTHAIAFSFVGASNASYIYWDPEAGVGYSSSGFSHVATTMAAIIGAASTLMLALL